jgi:hypothetical protein
MTFARTRALHFLLATFVLLTALSVPSRADTVYLLNGSVFENVIVTARTGSYVRMRLPYGELSLRTEQIERIVEEKGDFETFLEKRRGLDAASAEPGEWLALAEWAEERGLVYGYRELLQILAKREPLFAGLAPHMRDLGYELDADVGAWVRPRTGKRPSIPRHVDDAAKPEPRRAATSVSDHLSRAVELMAEADLERARQEKREAAPPTERYLVQTVPVWSTVVWTGWSFPQQPSSQPPPPADPNPEYPIVRHPSDPMARALLRRQPGSVIPLSSLAH